MRSRETKNRLADFDEWGPSASFISDMEDAEADAESCEQCHGKGIYMRDEMDNETPVEAEYECNCEGVARLHELRKAV